MRYHQQQIPINHHHMSTPSFSSLEPPHMVQSHHGGIILCLLLVVSMLLSSCEKDMVHYQEMSIFHLESCTLQKTDLDSIARFTHKVESFAAQHPDAKADPLYSEIQENIRRATLYIRVICDPSWRDVDIVFGFGEENKVEE